MLFITLLVTIPGILEVTIAHKGVAGPCSVCQN
jgi:hypothetical protein